jgi:apolipoprotein N-acyltransferase
LQRPHLVASSVDDSGLFHHLESTWRLSPGPSPNSTWLSFSVDFAFLNPLYANVAGLFFTEVVQRMMGAFEGRCAALYGPPRKAGAAQPQPQPVRAAVQQQQLQQQQQQQLQQLQQQQQHTAQATPGLRQQQGVPLPEGAAPVPE